MLHSIRTLLQACAEPRAGKTPLTWLRPRVMQALWDLHKARYAHSVEVWDCEPQLVGGVFGIAIGEIFFGDPNFPVSAMPRKLHPPVELPSGELGVCAAGWKVA